MAMPLSIAPFTAHLRPLVTAENSFADLARLALTVQQLQ